MTRFGPPLVSVVHPPAASPPKDEQQQHYAAYADAKPFSPLAAAMTQQLDEFDGVSSDVAFPPPPFSQAPLHASQHASPLHVSHLASGSTAATYAAMFEDFDRQMQMGESLPAVYANNRLWLQQRDVNIVYGRDVIQVPLRVEASNNDYVNLVLSHREFDVMAVHISEYDKMRPSDLLDEITRLLKEQAEKHKHKRNAFPLNNQLCEFPDSSASFQARILELEYELSRLQTKLAAARALQTTLTDENTLLRSNLREMEERCVDFESVQMQNEVLREQSVGVCAENAKLKKMLMHASRELRELGSEVKSLRTRVHYEQDEISAQVDHSMNALIAHVRDREHVLQESYLEEKKERQLIAEKYYEISGRIRVFCRLRPVTRSLNKTPSSALLRPKQNTILVDRSGKEFSFDQVFGPENSQSDVYAQMEPVVVSFADGYNACIMAYGQTGSGKTFTMVGGSGELQGMIPRALQQVFTMVNSRQLTYKDTLKVSMVEIYNDQILDLLTDGDSGVKIKNENEITTRSVTLWEHVNAVLAEGNANRNVASTSMNVESSRSHALVFLHLESQHRETLEVRKSTLCLVDLAGSERISRSQVEGDRLKEAQHINKSLSALGDVMHALQHKAKHVPYRNSKLTYMLREMLSGQAKTLMMLQLSPEDEDVEETICSLQFGARVSQIQMGAVKTSVESGEIFTLKEENRALSRKLVQLQEQVSVWKSDSQLKQEELNEMRGRSHELEAQLDQQQDDMMYLQEKIEAAAAASVSSDSPPPSPQKSDAPLSPTTSAQSVRSTRSASSTNSTAAAGGTPPTGRATRANNAPKPTASVSRLTTRAATACGASSTTGVSAADRSSRRKSLTTLQSPASASVLAARERLARASNEPLTPANRRATLGAIGSSVSQPNLTTSTSPANKIPRSRAPATASAAAASPSPTPRPTAVRRTSSLAAPKNPVTPASTAAKPSAAARSTPTASTLEKRRSLAGTRSLPSTPSGPTARTRPSSSTATGGGAWK